MPLVLPITMAVYLSCSVKVIISLIIILIYIYVDTSETYSTLVSIENKFLTIKSKYILKYDIRISIESIVCHIDTINYEIGFLYIIIYIVNI